LTVSDGNFAFITGLDTAAILLQQITSAADIPFASDLLSGIATIGIAPTLSPSL